MGWPRSPPPWNNNASRRFNSRPPLRGVQMGEFCSTAAGPYGAMPLADMGAEIVKREPR
ncbi:CoA transferase [Variovorax fucosicus]|uniref:CoA transferase n=1 Tax=Variovorax fucosicus TaxID=3053517 RepID=UPI003365A8BE